VWQCCFLVRKKSEASLYQNPAKFQIAFYLGSTLSPHNNQLPFMLFFFRAHYEYSFHIVVVRLIPMEFAMGGCVDERDCI
jgi:hypothetical protein